MKQVPIKLGPLALLLTVISICLTVLAILTFSTARADLRLAEKYADTVYERYALEAQGQSFLAELAGNEGLLSELEQDESGVYRGTFAQGGAKLSLGLQADGRGGWEIVDWRQTREWEEDTSLGNLWAGN